MCDMCRSNDSDNPTVARPLNKYDFVILTLGSVYNMTIVVLQFFNALINMARYQSSIEAKHAEDWAKISQDLETLEAENG